MKLIGAYLQLIRWPNLVFIALTQFLFKISIIDPIFAKAGLEPVPGNTEFFLLSFSSVLIAAAGYIINDYFDINIDRYNKPEKTVLDKTVSRRKAIIWHMILSVTGVAMGFLVHWTIGICNAICAILLWFYSTTFKKQLLIGNLLISFLTAWVVMVMGFRVWVYVMMPQQSMITSAVDLARILRFTFLYAGFAFIISLVREVIKDLEDMEGDAKYGCTTMPIEWGIPVSKVFTAVWLIVLLMSLAVIQVYVIQFGWWWSAAYTIGLIILPGIMILKDLFPAVVSQDFHRLSTRVKWVMLFGILSMIFFKFYS
jgi:4-hydroxybenzoate polyprenyltransferase